MLPEGSRVIVAVSGGADSVCLLHILRELLPNSVAGVAHFNHQWRAEASDEDERFVADLASSLAIPFFRAEATPSKGNREQEARRARQKFFAGLSSPVALGHTRDDQAETVLFRILRGSGLTGLAGIAPTSKGIIRPLIDTTRAEVEQYLGAREIPWREDATNRDPAYARNRIRHELLPQLARDWNPKITNALANLADLAQEEEKYWASVGQGPGLSSGDLRVDTLLSLPRSQGRRLIRRAIAQAKGDLRGIDFQHIESVFEIRKTLHLPGLTVTKSLDWLRFSSGVPIPALAQEIHPPGKFHSPDGSSQICVDIAQVNEAKACATLNVEACWFQSCSPLVLRGWRPGDRYRPAGQSRDHKIQEMFQKARVPSWRRASWPILTSEDKILWSRQFGIAQEAAVHSSNRETGEKRAILLIREVI